MCAARIRVGIGSWSDPEYIGVLFPNGTKATERLTLYAQRLGHVEINSSYYRTPTRAQTKAWVAQTPRDFTFDVKLHRAFSNQPEGTAKEGRLVTRLLDGVEPLIAAKKLRCFFLVLPPRFSPEDHRLEELDPLVKKLSPHLLAVELRHNRWVTGAQRKRTLDFFRSRKLVWIAVDMPQVKGSVIMPAVDEVTNPRLAYLRLHGRNMKWWKVKTAADRHTYDYSPKELRELAARVRALARKAKEVHVIANNHARDFAPKAALALKELLGGGRSRV
jgi:uncharacterized protein YecE (DUF72 family)